MAIEQERSQETELLAEKILKIHDLASEIRGSCYAQFNHSSNAALIDKARENLDAIGDLTKQKREKTEEATENNEAEVIKNFLNGQSPDLQEALTAADSLERKSLEAISPVPLDQI